MTQWKVCTMVLGGGWVDQSTLVRYQVGHEIHAKYIALAATDGERKVVIDTGCRVASTSNNPKFHRTPEEELETVLKKCMGWDLEDVDTVINTHLHSDHCGGNYLFPNAVFFVQRDEWEAAHQLMPNELYYEPVDYGKERINYFRWKLIDGDEELFPGLKVIYAPGHTAGSQFVLLDTEEGVLCFAGDVIPTRVNLEQFLEPGITVDSKKALYSMELVCRCANYVVFGHDDCINTGMRKNFPKVPSAHFFGNNVR